jgi:hypothetical protein
MNFSGFSVSVPEGTKPEKRRPQVEFALDWTS